MANNPYNRSQGSGYPGYPQNPRSTSGESDQPRAGLYCSGENYSQGYYATSGGVSTTQAGQPTYPVSSYTGYGSIYPTHGGVQGHTYDTQASDTYNYNAGMGYGSTAAPNPYLTQPTTTYGTSMAPAPAYAPTYGYGTPYIPTNPMATWTTPIPTAPVSAVAAPAPAAPAPAPQQYEDSLKCDVCGQTFSRPADVKRHKKIHDTTTALLKCRYSGCTHKGGWYREDKRRDHERGQHEGGRR